MCYILYVKHDNVMSGDIWSYLWDITYQQIRLKNSGLKKLNKYYSDKTYNQCPHCQHYGAGNENKIK